MENIRWLYVFIVAFIISQLATPLSIIIARRLGILDFPDSARKIHQSPIPRIGGLAIFIAFIMTVIRNFQFSQQLTGLVVGSSIIYILGLLDDIRPLPATMRLIIQIGAGLVVVLNGVCITFIPNDWFAANFIEGALTIIWLIGLANAINFLDGVDGLAASMVAVSSLFFFLIAWPSGQEHLVWLTMALIGACAGFLPYNWHRASVFLGDSGATFMGFLIAGLAVMGTWANNNATVAFSTPLLILGIPIFDMIYTTISRIRKGLVRNFKEWLEYAGRDHFHHRLMHLKFSETNTVFFIILVNICLGLGALVIRTTGTRGSLIMLLQSVFIFTIIVVLMIIGRHEYETGKEKTKNERTQ
ncbi:MAG: undecaprenyl/decaprenyl-phosphate alpha-N-acetylglucosaminyl 1-phosphate transferase [Endomicrobiales bacterium]|nr:undecaprenyl/decaprenyl-phosphate alpha-N-acetylglucosaminyl 1-phosphate transferase [Endomicrobiales bacterium]